LKKVLFIGGSSVLAYNWAKLIRHNSEIYLLKNKTKIYSKDYNIIDINSFDFFNLDRVFFQIKPDIVINCAALTSIEYCEKNIEESFRVNAELPKIIASICKTHKIKFVQISTDHLFNGLSNEFYTEKSFERPLNVYAKTKLIGEQEAIKNNKETIIIRTNFFGWTNGCKKLFPEIIIDTLTAGNQIQLFDDVFFNPIDISIIQQTVDILISKNHSGIFNVTSNIKISKYEFGLKIADKFNLDKSLIIPISIKSKQELILRPQNMALSNFKIKRICNRISFDLEDSINFFKNQLINKTKNERKRK